jgi:hypothetical protein
MSLAASLRAPLAHLLAAVPPAAIDSFSSTRAAICHAQATVTSLGRLRVCPSPALFALEKRATDLMSEISENLQRVVDCLRRKARLGPLPALPSADQVAHPVAVLSDAQVQRSLALIRDLESLFAQNAECQSAALDQLKDMLSAFAQLRGPSELPTSCGDVTDHDLSELRAAAIAHQSAELRAFRSTFDALPDISEVNVLAVPPAVALPGPVRLPVLISRRRFGRLSDPYLDSAMHLLGQLANGPPVQAAVRVTVPERPRATQSDPGQRRRSCSPISPPDCDSQMPTERRWMLIALGCSSSWTRLRRDEWPDARRRSRGGRSHSSRTSWTASIGRWRRQSPLLAKLEGDEPKWRISIADQERRKANLVDTLEDMRSNQERLERTRNSIRQIERENQEIDEKYQRLDATHYENDDD